MTVRRYQPADRSRALDRLGDGRVIDSPSNRLHVAEEGSELVGLSVWLRPDAGGEGELGALILSDPTRLRLMYQIAAAACQDAIDQGMTTGRFTIKDRLLLDRLQRDFTIDPQPSGRDPGTGRTVEWEVRVDLRDALQQLARVT